MALIDAVIENQARAAVRALARRTPVRAAYLFGSRIDGTFDAWSDIDVAAFIEPPDPWNLERRVEICVEVRRQVGDNVELHLFPAEALERPPRASFAQYILTHGVHLDLDDLEPNPGECPDPVTKDHAQHVRGK